MELNLKKETYLYYEAAAESPSAFETTQEAIVPDYCADVGRVVEASGAVLVHNKDLTPDGRVEVNGVIKANVLFVPEGGREVGAVHLSIPFHNYCETRDLAAGDKFCVAAELRSIDARLLNPRKLLIRADLVLEPTVYKECSVQLCTAVDQEAEGLQLLEDTAETTVIADTMEREFSYVEEMSLSASRREIREILNTRTEIYPAEAKIIGNKLVMKGIVRGEILYLDTAGELGNLSQEYLFSQIVETTVPEEAGSARVSYALTGFEYQLGSENDREEGHTVTMSLHIRSQIEILEKRQLRFLSDLYSIKKEAKLERKTLTVLEQTHSYSKKQNMREMVETGVAAKQVVDASVRCGSCALQRGEDGAMAVTPVSLCVLYLDENDALLMTEKDIQLRGEIDISDGSDPMIRVHCPGEVAASPTPEGIEVRFTPEFTIDTGIRSQRTYVSDGTLEEPAGEGERGASIVLRKFGDGARLWDIAKQYHTTGADILAANELESEAAIPADRLLLIPRRRV